MINYFFTLIVISALVISSAPMKDKKSMNQTDLYISGSEGYHTYRIPALLLSKKGTLLAFCEGRKTGRSDTGDIDMLVRRSEDGGKSWDKQQVIWDDAANVCGNPCPVLDEETGTIWLLMTWNLGTDRESEIIAQTSEGTRRVFVTSSRDDGLTWETPKEITATVKKPEWTWYATGPCTGIQIQEGEYKGRLIIPCDHIEAETNKYYSHVIYSDDHGLSWKLGGTTPFDQVNECQAVELVDSRIMLNMRNYDRSKNTRVVSISNDGGLTWGPLNRDPALIEPICQGSIIRYTQAAHQDKNRILFSNPASETERARMTVRLSYDEGKSWAVSKLLHEGPSAYSDLAVLPQGQIACFYERGEVHPYEKISLASFDLSWLTNGEDVLK
jgi:sialidase-1